MYHVLCEHGACGICDSDREVKQLQYKLRMAKETLAYLCKCNTEEQCEACRTLHLLERE